MGCPNYIHIKFEYALGQGIPWLDSQGPHEQVRTM
jgi:hypothetical protein